LFFSKRGRKEGKGRGEEERTTLEMWKGNVGQVLKTVVSNGLLDANWVAFSILGMFFFVIFFLLLLFFFQTRKNRGEEGGEEKRRREENGVL
jgi:phosphotransferase system  glucose/maltose/N-acetylglucosamine-specific IIC component